MEESRHINEEYSKIGMELIKSEQLLDDIRQSEATIIYLSSDKEKKSKGKTVFAECEKINSKYKWAIPCDFTITVYEPNVIALTEDQIRILIFHELLHVGIEYMNDGSEKYSVKPHDVEEFRAIIDRFGIDWSLPEWEVADDAE